MSTGPEFHPFYWLYPGTYQPLQATAILLDDVLKSPFSEEAQHSRMLVEKLFSLVGPHGIGLSNGRNSNKDLSPAGKEVWEMLRRLRRRAWGKAGIDPDMAWLDDNFVHSILATDKVTTLDPTLSAPNLAPARTSETGTMVPECNDSSAVADPKLNTALDEIWTDNSELYGENTSLPDHFASNDLSGLDWGEWDFLVDRYLHLPDPGQLNF